MLSLLATHNHNFPGVGGCVKMHCHRMDCASICVAHHSVCIFHRCTPPGQFRGDSAQPRTTPPPSTLCGRSTTSSCPVLSPARRPPGRRGAPSGRPFPMSRSPPPPNESPGPDHCLDRPGPVTPGCDFGCQPHIHIHPSRIHANPCDLPVCQYDSCESYNLFLSVLPHVCCFSQVALLQCILAARIECLEVRKMAQPALWLRSHRCNQPTTKISCLYFYII